ncbi:hypothetical protein N431DRAFT_465992 [Stipitochalara longipes BDJ]|nr:hypothetical protein N431DRAFT_465992 [Stipitochalara longipes BDJ]
MLVNIRSVAFMALATISVSASPAPIPEELTYKPAGNSSNSALYDFQYRFYSNGGCDHSTSDAYTYPPDSQSPFQGTIQYCYSAPIGTNWNRLEIDATFPVGPGVSVITFCNVQCAGGQSAKQQGTHCYIPVDGCAIGSFAVTS